MNIRLDKIFFSVGSVVTVVALTVFWLLMLGIAIVIPIGWVMNLFDVAAIVGQVEDLTAVDALHIAGVLIVPIGAVMGIFF